MPKDLSQLKDEIEGAIAKGNFVVFRGLPRHKEPLLTINWDTKEYLDPLPFLDVAQALGVRLIVFNHRQFSEELLDSATGALESITLPHEEYREYERSIARMRGFVGFMCALEMSFDHEGNTYQYDVVTPWYDEFLSVLDDLEDFEDISLPDELEDDEPAGGYFSNN
jgi:hypothetical protein